MSKYLFVYTQCFLQKLQREQFPSVITTIACHLHNRYRSFRDFLSVMVTRRSILCTFVLIASHNNGWEGAAAAAKKKRKHRSTHELIERWKNIDSSRSNRKDGKNIAKRKITAQIIENSSNRYVIHSFIWLRQTHTNDQRHSQGKYWWKRRLFFCASLSLSRYLQI